MFLLFAHLQAGSVRETESGDRCLQDSVLLASEVTGAHAATAATLPSISDPNQTEAVASTDGASPSLVPGPAVAPAAVSAAGLGRLPSGPLAPSARTAASELMHGGLSSKSHPAAHTATAPAPGSGSTRRAADHVSSRQAALSSPAATRTEGGSALAASFTGGSAGAGAGIGAGAGAARYADHACTDRRDGARNQYASHLSLRHGMGLHIQMEHYRGAETEGRGAGAAAGIYYGRSIARPVPGGSVPHPAAAPTDENAPPGGATSARSTARGASGSKADEDEVCESVTRSGLINFAAADGASGGSGGGSAASAASHFGSSSCSASARSSSASRSSSSASSELTLVLPAADSVPVASAAGASVGVKRKHAAFNHSQQERLRARGGAAGDGADDAGGVDDHDDDNESDADAISQRNGGGRMLPQKKAAVATASSVVKHLTAQRDAARAQCSSLAAAKRALAAQLEAAEAQRDAVNAAVCGVASGGADTASTSSQCGLKFTGGRLGCRLTVSASANNVCLSRRMSMSIPGVQKGSAAAAARPSLAAAHAAAAHQRMERQLDEIRLSCFGRPSPCAKRFRENESPPKTSEYPPHRQQPAAPELALALAGAALALAEPAPPLAAAASATVLAVPALALAAISGLAAAVLVLAAAVALDPATAPAPAPAPAVAPGPRRCSGSR